MGYFAMNIGSNSAEEDIEVAIANLKLFLEALPKTSEEMTRPCDYLFSFTESCINDARKKIEEGRILKSENPSESYKYY